MQAHVKEAVTVKHRLILELLFSHCEGRKPQRLSARSHLLSSMPVAVQSQKDMIQMLLGSCLCPLTGEVCGNLEYVGTNLNQYFFY